MIIGLIFAFIFVMVVNPEENWGLVAMIVFIGSLLPDLDFGFRVRLKKSFGNFVGNAFLIPFLITLVFPKNILLTAFFVGYASHLVADMNKKHHMVFIKERGMVALLWIIAILIISTFFETNLETVLKFFSGEI